MAQTPNYHLFLTDDDAMSFLAWRDAMNGQGDSNMKKIDTALGEKANKSRSITITLAADGWIENRQTIQVSGISAYDNGIIALANGATDEQSMAATYAMIDVYESKDGYVTVVARGDIPEIDIPANILIVD